MVYRFRWHQHSEIKSLTIYFNSILEQDWCGAVYWLANNHAGVYLLVVSSSVSDVSVGVAIAITVSVRHKSCLLSFSVMWHCYMAPCI